MQHLFRTRLKVKTQNALFDKRLAEEEADPQGIKARRTRNEGRVRALKELRKERKQRVEQVGKQFQQLKLLSVRQACF